MPKEEKEEVVEEAVVHEEDWGKEALTSNHISVRNRSQFSRSIIGPSERPMTD